MRRSRRRNSLLFSHGNHIDLAPMVDIAFNLLVFFMLATTFITNNSGLAVDLPQATSAQGIVSDLPTVTITPDLQMYISGSAVTETTLVTELRATLNKQGVNIVILRADKTVPHGTTVRVMDLIKQAGAQRIAIATGGN
jgi:biopolymer transport protein ExbD